MDHGLEGKVAVVAGTASQIGIGRTVCLTLANEGCDIVSADMEARGPTKQQLQSNHLGEEPLRSR